MANSSSDGRPYPLSTPRALGDAAHANSPSVLANRVPYTANLYGPVSLPSGRSGSVTDGRSSSWCPSRRVSPSATNRSIAGGRPSTPRSVQQSLPHGSAGAPQERLRIGFTPPDPRVGLQPSERIGTATTQSSCVLPSGRSGTLIAGMTTDGNWSAPPPSMTSGLIPPLPASHDVSQATATFSGAASSSGGAGGRARAHRCSGVEQHRRKER